MVSFLRNRDAIESSGQSSSPLKERNAMVSVGRLEKYRVGQFDQFEIQLYDEFTSRYRSGLKISSAWLMARMKQLLENSQNAHKCTKAWLGGYRNRFDISYRKASNTHTQTVEERIDRLETFYKFVKTVCTPPSGILSASKFGRFALARRIHGDQVPLEFQGSLTHTLAPKGAKRVQLKQPKMNIDFRVATLMLYFVAEAQTPWLRPAICFRLFPFSDANGLVYHSMPKSGRVKAEIAELQQEFPEIDIYVQKKAYFDNSLCLAAANDLVDSFPDSGEYLVCVDNLSGQTNLQYRDILKKEGNAFIVYTPPNCTDVCAVTDAGLGRSIKNLMRKHFIKHFETHLDLWVNDKVTPKERRHLYCEWLVAAMTEFYGNEGQKQVLRAFEKCGLAGAYDGSEDHLIAIDGFDCSKMDLSL